MRWASEHRCGTKGIGIHVLGSIVSGSKNSETFLCENKWRADTVSKIKELFNVLPNGAPWTMADWRRKPFYKEPLTKPVGRKRIGNDEASQNIYSHFLIYFLNTREQGGWSKFCHLKCPMGNQFLFLWNGGKDSWTNYKYFFLVSRKKSSGGQKAIIYSILCWSISVCLYEF